ncbi:hypothetical protein [Streptomyces sp. NPDC058092]|uniref:hypothetical protein n=1 Tax=Streptomyces sp. NPDC058092 TaxID=3346336 RepID=UPI0036E66E11
MPASKTKQALTAERRKEMFRRRAAGESMEDIAASFGMSRSTLSKDFTRAYRAYIEEEKAEAEVWRKFQTDRYERLLAAVWPDALDGDVRANEQARKLVADLSDLNGWKAPVRAEVTGADGGPLSLTTASPDDLAALIAATSRLDEDQPDNSKTSTPDEEDEGDQG